MLVFTEILNRVLASAIPPDFVKLEFRALTIRQIIFLDFDVGLMMRVYYPER